MTDRVRTSAWATALVLGPVAAALFTASTAWAASHPPASTPSVPMTVTSTSAPADPMTDLQRTLDEETARVHALEQLVASLRAQAAAIGASAPSAGRQTGSGAGAVGAAPVASRPPATVRRTSPPPAVHTVTGGSSAKAAP